jgi:hypothetical protein
VQSQQYQAVQQGNPRVPCRFSIQVNRLMPGKRASAACVGAHGHHEALQHAVAVREGKGTPLPRTCGVVLAKGQA